MMPITTITAGVLAELSKLGYAESTLKSRRRVIKELLINNLRILWNNVITRVLQLCGT